MDDDEQLPKNTKFFIILWERELYFSCYQKLSVAQNMQKMW